MRSGLTVFTRPREGSIAISMQLAAWALQWISCYVLLVALGLEHKADLGAAAAILFAVNVTAVLPVTPSNLGVFQAACMAVLVGAYGVAPAQALGYGIILQAVEVATAVIMGAPALVKEGLSWREVRLRALHSAPVSLARSPRKPRRSRGAERLERTLGVGARLGVEAREVGGLVVGVEAARVREDPDGAAADRLLLQAHRRLSGAERGPVGGRGRGSRPAAAGCSRTSALELGRARAQLLAAELGGGARRAGGDVGDADAVARAASTSSSGRSRRGVKPGGVQRGIEAVARPREVVADLGRAQPGVDADEEDLESGADDRWAKHAP